MEFWGPRWSSGKRTPMAASPSSLPRCPLTTMLLLLTQLDSGPAHSLGGHLDVRGPPEPILALVGEDSELPCHLASGVNAEHMELRWFRNTFSPAVLVLQGGQEQEGEQMPEYRGRVTLKRDNITVGQVALQIHRTRTFDEGVYGCSFRAQQAQGEAFVGLKVAALGSAPHVTVQVLESGEVRLECTSAGWYPEPQVQWRTAKGEKLPSTAESRSPDEEGLFTVAASVTLRDSSMDRVSCCIRNVLLGQEQEVGISIPAPSWPFWNTFLGTAVPLGLGIAAAFFAWKLYEKKRTKRSDKTGPVEWELARSHAVDVTLDPDTAHPHLFLYEDAKSVRLEDSRQKLPESPERFDSWPCVLGREAFTEGRRYWEVEVGDRSDWLVGVCRENVKKKGFILMSPRAGFWVMELSEKGYWALTPLRTLLQLTRAPRRVGIFLNYESGTVSFYNVNDRSHIYTFPKTCLSGPIRPLFCLWSCDEKPLTICPVARPLEVTIDADA